MLSQILPSGKQNNSKNGEKTMDVDIGGALSRQWMAHVFLSEPNPCPYAHQPKPVTTMIRKDIHNNLGRFDLVRTKF